MSSSDLPGRLRGQQRERANDMTALRCASQSATNSDMPRPENARSHSMELRPRDPREVGPPGRAPPARKEIHDASQRAVCSPIEAASGSQPLAFEHQIIAGGVTAQADAPGFRSAKAVGTSKRASER